MSEGRKPLDGAATDDRSTLERLVYEHTRLNVNQAADTELVGYVVNAMRALLEMERERIINSLPGGHSVDPQWVADMVRWGRV